MTKSGPQIHVLSPTPRSLRRYQATSRRVWHPQRLRRYPARPLNRWPKRYTHDTIPTTYAYRARYVGKKLKSGPFGAPATCTVSV